MENFRLNRMLPSAGVTGGMSIFKRNDDYVNVTTKPNFVRSGKVLLNQKKPGRTAAINSSKRSTYRNVHAGGSHSFILDEGGKVFAFGDNSNGVLGLGLIESAETPTLVSVCGERDQVVNIATSHSAALTELAPEHTLFLTRNGRVYASGCNEHGVLGLGTTKRVRTPHLIHPKRFDNNKIKDISVGAQFSLLLDEDGCVYSLGLNKSGQLGVGSSKITTVPVKINHKHLSEVKFTAISAGRSFSLLLDSNGNVYSCGNNVSGQLGLGHTNNVLVPTLIESEIIIDKKITRIAAGDSHTLLLTEDGSIFAMGSGALGALGNGNTSGTADNCATEPVYVSHPNINNKRIIDISAGYYTSMLLADDGSVFAFGLNFFGQLGIGSTMIIGAPSPVLTDQIPEKIVGISAGNAHFMMNDESGNVFVFGYRANHRLGLGSNRGVQPIPVQMEFINVKSKMSQRDYAFYKTLTSA